MLILTRNVHQTLIINNNIVVYVLEVRGNQVRIGIEAPSDVPVHRSEVYARIQNKKKEKADEIASESKTGI